MIFVILFSINVAGLALASVISQALAAAIVVRVLVHEQGLLRLDLYGLQYQF